MCSGGVDLNPSLIQTINKCQRYIANKPAELFQRLGLLWCRKDTARMMGFSPKMIPPSAYPIDIRSASECAKLNLFHYIAALDPYSSSFNTKFIIQTNSRNPSTVVLEKLWLNFAMSDRIDTCYSCDLAWDKLPKESRLSKSELESYKCDKGHSLITRKDLITNIAPLNCSLNKIVSMVDISPGIGKLKTEIAISIPRGVVYEEIGCYSDLRTLSQFPPLEDSGSFNLSLIPGPDCVDRTAYFLAISSPRSNLCMLQIPSSYIGSILYREWVWRIILIIKANLPNPDCNLYNIVTRAVCSSDLWGIRASRTPRKRYKRHRYFLSQGIV